ncbi:PPOX class F420-dependent oxidoreductase [Antrihabitans sp. YC2-6]|uniref:PPOX class F420-dependent oxidoreductase n=1 Tax=Antrihabitans sp. YC2-6 TaxID=2799498 RepID=UPI0018F3D5CB|nr:PPOX class F420-dependent oxidoreductase [Antrihabitans sp. YC2-6]MBJ8345566.1 PPOX class F420-dependent oxidoreductase [Antrihabitans sp. YC2-6]
MSNEFAQVGKAQYLMLTTFRKDGTPVGTPLWAAPDGEKILIWTVTDSWKVKRIKRNPDVTLQVCDMRGKLKGDVVVKGRAEILDAKGTDRARSVISKKYGITGLIAIKASLLRRGKSGTIGISVVPA